MRWIPGVLLLTALALPASAHAAPVLNVDLARESVRYGQAHRVDGTFTDGTRVLADQEVVLEGRRYPYEGSYRVIEHTKTNAEGEFRFDTKLDRNHRLRVFAPAQKLRSERLQSYTLPGFQSYTTWSGGVHSAANDAAAGRTFLNTLVSSDSATAIRKAGMDPM